MKNFILIIAIFISSSILAEEQATCSANVNFTGTNEIEKFAGDFNCAKLKQDNQCTHKVHEDPELRKKISDGLTNLDNLYKENNGKLEVKKFRSSMYTDLKTAYPDLNTQVARSFMAYTKPGARQNWKKVRIYQKEVNKKKASADLKNEYQIGISRDTKIPLISNLHEFLETSKSVEDYDSIKDTIVDNYIAFKSKYECKRGVYYNSESRGMLVSSRVSEAFKGDYNNKYIGGCFKTEAAAKAAVSDNKATILKKFGEKYSGVNSVKNRYSCSDKINVKKMGNVRRRKPSCTGSFTKNFRDNQWELSDRDKEKLKGNEDYIKFKTCIEKMEAAGNEIDKVIVSSSSSQLDNTNDLFPAKKKFCAKGFKELSKARTNSTLDVLKGEFSTGASGKTAQLTNILGDKNNNQIQLSFGGSNRNGTSGECPYALNANGDEVMKPEYRRGGKQRAELDKAKFTKVKIVFKPKYESLGSNGKNPCYKATVNCKKLTMQCIGGGIQPGWPKTK